MSATLARAVQSADSHQVSALVADGSDASYRDPETGLTVLMMAAGRGDAATVRALIEAGADVLTADRDAGATALHKACQGGSLEVVTALVEAGAFVDAVAPTTGHTALMDALWFKFPEIAKYLMAQGAGLNLSTHYGFSLKEHFEYELNVNTVGKDRLLLADQYLKDRQADDDRLVSEQQLMAAVAGGNTDAARKLIAAGADVDERAPRLNNFNDAHTPLLVAARDGHTDIARLLLDAGADVNAVEPVFGAVPLHKAVYNGHSELTRMIAAQPSVWLNYQGATNGYSPLHDALWHGYEECAQELVSAGARLDLRGHDGKTPLDLAVEVFGSDHPLTSRIRTGAMIRQLIFAAPKPGMSVGDFQRYWLEVHAPRYASKIPQIRKYLVDTRLPFEGDETPPLWSGAAEIWLANDEEQLASMQTPEFLDGARARSAEAARTADHFRVSHNGRLADEVLPGKSPALDLRPVSGAIWKCTRRHVFDIHDRMKPEEKTTMLFYVQMKWNHEGRLSLDEIWDLESEEAKHAKETVDSGFCVGIWKVAAQKRVIAITNSPDAEELDRTALGRLPMREYLEFEAVWPLRDYLGFAEDVQKHYQV